MTAEQATWFAGIVERVVDNVERVLVGKRAVVRLAVVALFSEGHLLVEDLPGTGKTTLARALAESVQGNASRIQFTPDLLPGDITGVTVFDQRDQRFVFHPGPVFANVVVADEINRASPKTQSALLEVMQENHVTVDGEAHPVPRPFLVVATQNPIEQAGTYRLPEAQLDRFLMRIAVGYPDHLALVRILTGAADEGQVPSILPSSLAADCIRLTRTVHVDPVVADYIARLVEATRDAQEVRVGASVRAAVALLRAARTLAAASGRHYVVPDDVKALAVPVLAHRLVLEPDAEFEGVDAVSVIAQVLIETPPPSDRQPA